MNTLRSLYQPSLSLLTDLYQITMAYGYWQNGLADRESIFHLFFRRKPFRGGYALACGLEQVINFIKNFRIDESDAAYLRTLQGHDGSPLLSEAFIRYLLDLRFSCSVDALPEGTLVFENEPILKVKGPLLQAQLLETPLLNIINYQTLIATKSSRICQAAGDAPVLEFGLRRAQGIDGGLSASRAAFIGGCAATSNLLAGKTYGIPVSGTHAHSWVMSFDSELEAFEKYAAAMENNCVLLVDTYNTRQGIANAIAVGKSLKNHGKKLLGIRIDSGDLAYLSQLAREMLDKAGLEETNIIASNDLDEFILESLSDQHAKIDMVGVGTKLVTAYDQPALGGVYKLSALQNATGGCDYKIKLSEQSIKINIPGDQQILRYYKDDIMVADMIYDMNTGYEEISTLVDPNDPTKTKTLHKSEYTIRTLLQPVFKSGKCIYDEPDLLTIKKHAATELGMLHSSVKRFVNPHAYVVGLEKKLYELRLRLILEQRKLIS